MSEQVEPSGISREAAYATALFVDEIAKARTAILALEKIAKSSPSLSRKYGGSLAKIWEELDLVMEEFHKIDTF